eukprot:2381337-Prymnesium_polylepis.1
MTSAFDIGDDFEDDHIAERKRPPKPASSCKQDPQLVARVLSLARERKPLTEIDAALNAEGAKRLTTAVRKLDPE